MRTLAGCFNPWLAGILLISASAASAVSTRSIKEDDYAQFAQGELQSAALTSDGYLLPSYARRTLGDTGAEIVWDAVREPRGSYLCATGHHGQLVRIADDGTTRSLGKPGDPELTAMVRLADGSTLIAGAPSGRIYRLAADDTLTTAVRLKAPFVWRMARDARGDVWIATGGHGQLFRLHPKAGGGFDVEEVAKLDSSNLLDLWIDAEGKMGQPGDLFVAGQDPGWLYRVSPSGKEISVVFNAQAEEVRALLPFDGGLALALNTERAPTPQALNLTLRMAGGQLAGERPAPAQPQTGGDRTRSLEQVFSASRRGQYGPPRSEVVVLGREGFVRPLWTAPQRPINDMALSPSGALLLAVGGDGRLFEVQTTGEHSVVADVREDYLVRIVADGKGYLLTAARNGLLFGMDRQHAPQAVFLSQALDARLPVTWGRFHARGDLARGQKILAAFRSGNDGDVESKFWSAWSKDQSLSFDQPVALPAGPARFIQYRLTLQGPEVNGRPPRLDAADLYYLEPNGAPVIREIKVSATPDARPAAARRPPQPGQPAQPAPSAPASAGGNPGGPGQAAGADTARDARSNAMQLKIVWQAGDPNDDPLRYNLYFKGETEKSWLLIEEEMSVTQVPIDVGGVADGRYRFRVIATDDLGNPPGRALSAEKVSDAVTIDNTPPRIEKMTISASGKQALLRVEIADDLSVLSSVKVDIDNGDSLPLAPADGLLDERAETFEWRTEPLTLGEHVATLVATDAEGNSSVKKTVFSVD